MVKANLLKPLKAALSVVLLTSMLLVFSCNNKSDKDKKDADTTTKMESSDTSKMNNEPVKMESDTTHKDTGKGEQTPPPK